MYKKKKRILSLVLSLLMVCTMMPMPVSAAEVAEPEVKETVAAEDTVETPADAVQVITEFTALAQETKEQQLAIGAAEADIVLPDTLQAKAGEAETELTGITWVIDADNSAAASFDSSQEMNGAHYTYKPVIPEEYTLEEGVEVPEIVVLVEENQNIMTFSVAGFTEPSKEGDVYQIGTVGELYWFAAKVNGTEADGTQNKAACAKLVSDITVNTGVLNEDGTLNGSGENFRAWTPIGNEANQYSGTFDGDGHTIQGLYVKTTDNEVGLIGKSVGTIQNVNVADSYFEGGMYVGSVCGTNSNTIMNCTNSGSVSSSVTGGMAGGVCGKSSNRITNCTNSGSVSSSGANSKAGGVCGFASTGTIEGCINSGSVSGYLQTGGVCGTNTGGTITNCTNNGSVSGDLNAGGVCGYAEKGTIMNCTNSGSVSGDNTAGGVCGENDSAAIITNSINVGSVGGATDNGGVCGYNWDGSITNCYYDSEKCTVKGIADTDVLGSAEGKTTTEFASGAVTWLLNGSKSAPNEGETLAWYQNLDNDQTKDAYPVLDSSHGTVYQLADGSYSNSNAVAPTANSVQGHSLTLDGTIGVNFFLELTDAVIKDEKAVVRFTLPDGSTENINVSGTKADTTTVPGKTYYRFTIHVAAKEMADTIKLELLDGTGQVLKLLNGEQEALAHEYTVKEYADYMMAHPENTDYQKASPMIKAMLNYGSYAQVYFKNHADTLANANLSDNDNPLGTVTADTLSKFARTDAQVNELVTLAGSDLILESETTMRLYFTVHTEDTLTYTYNGKTLTSKTSGSYTYVEIKDINSANLDTTYTVTVSNGTNSYNMTYCPMSYAYNVLAKELTPTRTQELKEMITSLYLYNDESNKYYGK